MPLLSKSKFMIGLQCPVWLWKSFHAKHELPPFDAATQAKFAVGHEVGALAQRLFPGGILIPTENFSGNLKLTQIHLERRVPLFEPGFLAEDLFARPDILVPVDDDEWDVYEVKSSTSAKPEHAYDLAFQKHVYEKAGLRIRNSYLVHLDNTFVKHGDIRPEELLKTDDLTEQVEERLQEVPGLIEEQWRTIRSPVCPKPALAGQCSPLYGCPVHDEMMGALPMGNVFELYYAKAKASEIYLSGVHELSLIPTDVRLNAKQQVQVDAARTGEPHIEAEKLREWLSRLTPPVHYLDFETEMHAIPRHDGTRPYQQVPVQFSLHIEREDGSVEHKEFLHGERTDPRPAFAKALKEALGQEGSIITYNQSFETGRLKELAEALPEHQEWILKAIGRVEDLIIPFKEFWYYSPAQRGSCSLKATMPALLGKDHYAELEVHDGGTAQLEYQRITYTDVGEEERVRVRDNLLKYCCLDTEGMVWMVDALKCLSNAV